MFLRNPLRLSIDSQILIKNDAFLYLKIYKRILSKCFFFNNINMEKSNLCILFNHKYV